MAGEQSTPPSIFRRPVSRTALVTLLFVAAVCWLVPLSLVDDDQMLKLTLAVLPVIAAVMWLGIFIAVYAIERMMANVADEALEDDEEPS